MSMFWLAYSIMWISVATASIAGVYLTGSAWCLWALVLPLFVNINIKDKDKKED